MVTKWKAPPKIEGASEAEQERFDFAWNDLQFRLLGRQSCAKLFGGVDAANKALGNLTFSFENLGVAGDSARTSGSSVVINSRGSFMAKDGRMPGSSRNYGEAATMIFIIDAERVEGIVTYHDTRSISLSEIDYASFVLAHELGHKRRIYGKTNEDAGDIINFGKNNRPVWENCFE